MCSALRIPDYLKTCLASFPEHRVPHFNSGCWRSAAAVPHDLILIEVDGKHLWVSTNLWLTDLNILFSFFYLGSNWLLFLSFQNGNKGGRGNLRIKMRKHKISSIRREQVSGPDTQFHETKGGRDYKSLKVIAGLGEVLLEGSGGGGGEWYDGGVQNHRRICNCECLCLLIFLPREKANFSSFHWKSLGVISSQFRLW